jgi:hypothetical protein
MLRTRRMREICTYGGNVKLPNYHIRPSSQESREYPNRRFGDTKVSSVIGTKS